MIKKLAPLWLMLLALATYAPALRDGFVWDDQALILSDPLIRSWRLIGEGFAHFLFTDATASDFYRPLQRLSYTIDYAAFFTHPWGYHLVSILWHGLAGVAFFYFAQEFLARYLSESSRRFWISFLAAIIWLVHPVQSAAVIYVSGRADPMAAAFGFAGLYLGLRQLRAQGNARWYFGLGAGFCFLGSALSKEAGLIFLAIWLVLALGRWSRGALLGAGGLIASVLIAYLGLRFPAERIAPPPAAAQPALVRPVLIARAVAEYAGLLVFPQNLHMEREVSTRPFGTDRARMEEAARRELQTLLGLVLIGASTWGLWRVRHRPAIALPLLFSLLAYLPVSGLITLNATVAEHWLYLPSAFLFLGLAGLLESLGWPNWERLSWRAVTVALTAWLLFLPSRTFARTFDWKDQRTFLTCTLRDGGDSARMWINLGGLELSEGHLPAADAVLKRALLMEPGNAMALLNLGAVKLREGKLAEARACLQKVQDPPELRARAEESLAVLENREDGRLDLMRLRLAARLGPPNWAIEKRYIKALAAVQLSERALAELKTCLVAAPYRAESWQMLSQLLARLHHPEEAGIALAEAEANDVHLDQRHESLL